jgi:hypothetical protein
MKRASRLWAVVVVLLASACRHAAGPPPDQVIPGLAGASKVYTLTNLRPNDGKAVMYAANFLQDGLIPVCSEVTLLTLNEEVLTLRVNSTGREYQYVNHKSATEGFPQNLAKYFGPACPKKDLGNLTKQEREQVKIGQVIPGMRRRAVILAIGYPPERTTPSLEADTWRYWTSRMNSFLVVFDKGKVTRIVN